MPKNKGLTQINRMFEVKKMQYLEHSFHEAHSNSDELSFSECIGFSHFFHLSGKANIKMTEPDTYSERPPRPCLNELYMEGMP